MPLHTIELKKFFCLNTKSLFLKIYLSFNKIKNKKKNFFSNDNKFNYKNWIYNYKNLTLRAIIRTLKKL